MGKGGRHGLASLRHVEELAARVEALESQLDEHASYLQYVHAIMDGQSEINTELQSKVAGSLERLRDISSMQDFVTNKTSGVLVGVMRTVATVQKDLILAVEQAEMNHERISRINGMFMQMMAARHVSELESSQRTSFPALAGTRGEGKPS